MVQKSAKSKRGGEFIYIVAGEDGPIVDNQCNEIIEGVLGEGQRQTGLFDADAEKVTITEVLDELRTLPFLAQKRVVLVKKAEKFISANRELLERYFDKPSPTGVLIMTVKSWDSRMRLAKKLAGVGKLLTISQPRAWQFPDMLVRYAKDKYGKKLSREAAELIVEISGEDLARLYSEVDKLSLFVGEAESITADHIQSLTGHNRLFNVFAVIDAVTAGDVSGALGRLRSMFEADRSAEYTAVGAFAYHLRRMFRAKVMQQQGCARREIEGSLRIWHNREVFFDRLGGISIRQIGDYLRFLAETDFQIKKGRAVARAALERFVLRLAKGQDSGREA